jgi:hypothetical protein
MVKSKRVRWILGFGVAGLLVPAALMLHANLTRSLFGDRDLFLWPGSIALMSTEDPSMTKFHAAVIFGGALISNFVLYGALGALTWPIRRFVIRRRDSGSDLMKIS